MRGLKISNNDISWIVNDEKIPIEVKEKFLLQYEKDILIDIILNSKEPQLLSGVYDIVKYIIDNRERIDDILIYIDNKYNNVDDIIIKGSNIKTFEKSLFKKELAPKNAEITEVEIEGKKFIHMKY